MPKGQNFPHTISILAMATPLLIHFSNCRIKQLNCNVSSHIKGSCNACHVNSSEYLSPPPTNLLHGLLTIAVSPFQKNCVQCTISHQKCIFNVDNPSICKRCIKFDLPCHFKLSLQGRHNNLMAASSQWGGGKYLIIAPQFHHASDNQDDDDCLSSHGGGGKYTTIAPKSPRASVDDDNKDCGPHSPPRPDDWPDSGRG